MKKITRVPGSFRDPSGYVFTTSEGRVCRTIHTPAAKTYEALCTDKIIELSVEAGFLIHTTEVDAPELCEELNAIHILEHQEVPYISYPYEWTFEQLKSAALLHLKFQQFLLQYNYTLSDATAYNIQFIGHKPVFIDVLSIIPYKEGSIWNGYQQFLQQFLNPLLLTALKGIEFNTWYRGNIEGVSTADLLSTLSLRQRFNWRVFSFLYLYQNAESRVTQDSGSTLEKANTKTKGVSKKSQISMLIQFENWVKKLQPAKQITTWGNYAHVNTYENEERASKADFISEFTARNNLKTIIDLGCNTGDYSEAAINGGAEYVIGFDFDHGALSKAYQRAVERDIPFLPLWLDAANPSPAQGWLETERQGFSDRFKADGLIALAFEHHLAIAKNIPLEQVINWLVSIADKGIIEFVPKDDPTIQQMLSTRDDIFENYNSAEFEEKLTEVAAIIEKKVISKSGRTLYEYRKH